MFRCKDCSGLDRDCVSGVDILMHLGPLNRNQDIPGEPQGRLSGFLDAPRNDLTLWKKFSKSVS